MINAWWLFLIIPASVSFGFMVFALMAAASNNDDAFEHTAWQELFAMRDWLREQLGEWLPVETAHYPTKQLVEMREHLDHIEYVLAEIERRG